MVENLEYGIFDTQFLLDTLINITDNISILKITYAQSMVGKVIWIFRSTMICRQINDIRIAADFLVELLDEFAQLAIQF